MQPFPLPSPGETPSGVRIAVPEDRDEITRILTDAFADDPVWGPAFPDPELREAQASAYWDFMVGQALKYPESLVTMGPAGLLDAVAIWLPTGVPEVDPADAPTLEALGRSLMAAPQLLALEETGQRFAEARPAAPHAYLSLLATAPEARGRGEGMRLLAAALTRYDAAGIDTYLESSNPANNDRYRAQGYAEHRSFRLADGTPVQTFWRAARER